MEGMNVKLFDAVSMAANATSAPFSLKRIETCGLLLKWTGTPTGTFTIEVSDDYNGVGTIGDFNWFDVTAKLDEPIEAPAAGSGDEDVDLSGLPHLWARVKYAVSAGTGTLNGWVHGR